MNYASAEAGKSGPILALLIQVDFCYTYHHLPKKEIYMSPLSMFQFALMHVKAFLCPRTFVIGMSIAGAAWMWGRSPVPVWALKFFSGFGGLLVFSLCVATLLALIALFKKDRTGYLAYRIFQRILSWLLPKLLRSVSVFFGLVPVAAICWVVSGSGKALMAALMAMVLGATLAYCRMGLKQIAADLAKRAWRY